MARSTRTVGHRLAQALFGDRSLDRRRLRGGLPRRSKWRAVEELLCEGERGHRVWPLHRRIAPHGLDHTYAHAEPNGLPFSDTRPASERTAVHSFPDWFPR